MLRISHAGEASADDRECLRLEGQVRGPWVVELRRVCAEAISSNGPVVPRLVLDLRDVSFIDAEGIELFRELSAHRISLTNCSPFVAEQLKEVGHVDE